MKRTSTAKKRQAAPGAMRKEYRFDYSRAKPNCFAGRIISGSVAVILEPDVAARFKSSEAVNALLRSVISALPESEQYRG